jgi:hypothetical protein
MTILKTLRDVVAPELNHLYTVPPFQTASGLDLGWYCREHAVHTLLIAQLFGADADIRTGDFTILSPHVPTTSSIGSGADHSWCSVSGVAPIDLSMTFAQFGGGPQLRSAIIGEGKNGDWVIKYAEHESAIYHHQQSSTEVFLVERKVEPYKAEDLLQNPYCFIFPPRNGDESSWHVLYGQQIYAKITLHCFSVASGAAKPVRLRFSSVEAVRWISTNYADAAEQIRNNIE